jgi:hypothetical protein
MEDGRFVYHDSIETAKEVALQELKKAMVNNPTTGMDYSMVASEEDHQAQWIATRRILASAVANLFIASMKRHYANALKEKAHDVEEAKHAITKIVRGWHNRLTSLNEIKAALNKQIVNNETRRVKVMERLKQLKPTKLFDPKDQAEEKIYVNACKKLVELRRYHIDLLTKADGLELNTYANKIFGLGAASFRFISILVRDLQKVDTEYSKFIKDVKKLSEQNNRERMERCAALKKTFIHDILPRALKLLIQHGRSPDEIAVASAVYTDIPDTDPFCVQRCLLVESVLSKMDTSVDDTTIDNQQVAFGKAYSALNELKATAANLRVMTAEAMATGDSAQLFSIQAREQTVKQALEQAQKEVDQLAVSVVSMTEPAANENKETVLGMVKELKTACQSIRNAIESASNVPRMIQLMVTDQRHVQFKELFRAAVTNVKTASQIIQKEFNRVDHEASRLRDEAKKIDTEMSIVQKARSNYEPNSFNTDDVALYALRDELGRIEDILHTYHTQRLSVLSLIKAAEWIVNEGSRLLSKTA